MDKLKTTKQTLIFMVILTVAAVVSYVVLFGNIKEKNETVSMITNETDLAIQREIKLISVKDLIEDTEADRVKLDTYFVADDEIVNFIEDIEGLGKYTGTDVEVMAVNVSGDKKSTNDISELLNLDFEVKGKWADVFHLLLLLEKMPFKINISQINLQAIYDDDIKGGSSGIWKGFFNITVVKLK